MDINELETPVAIVNLDTLKANITKLQKYMDEHNIANRPHIKTHKIPEIAHMQVNAGAVGITCQKIGEAEIMVQAGLKDIFIPYNILGETKLERLMHLTRRATISVTADSEMTVRGLSAQILSTQQHASVDNASGGFRHELQQRQRGHGFPATRLAQERKCFARCNLEGNAIDRAHHALGRVEPGLEIFYLQQRFRHQGQTLVTRSE